MGILSNSKVLATCVLTLLLATGCSKEQTSLSIDDIKGKAKIVGSLAYSEGQSYANGQFSELVKPAAGKRVFVKISNSSLDPNGKAQGYTTYETVTDEAGEYEIEIPAVEKTEGMSVIVQPETFVGTRTLLATIDNGEPVFEQKEVVFEIAEQNITVKPNDIEVKDLFYGFTERDIEEGFPTTVPLSVKVGLGIVESVNNQVYGAFAFQSGKSVMITVTYGMTENTSPLVRNYAATTDFNGEALFNIPAKSAQWDNANITVKAMPFTVSSFNYYATAFSQVYPVAINGGIYYQYSDGVLDKEQNFSINFTGLDGVRQYVEARMVFKPFATVDSYGYNYSNYDWSNISFD